MADRVAQTVVARRLETRVEKIFHPDSYGYRPGRAARDAVEVCRRRCWSTDWVIDLDIQKFFDSVPRDLIIRAVEANTDLPWVVLYVKRWLDAPVQNPDGSVLRRDRGTQAREMSGFGLSWACSPAVTLSEVGLVGGPAVIGRARRGVPGMGGGSR